MGGMQPGDKLTAQNLNDNYMCRTDDTDSTGRIGTDKYFVNGKKNEAAGTAQVLTADVGYINLTPQTPVALGDATTLAPDALGLQDGQELTIINNSGADYTLGFLSPTVTLDDGKSFSLVYCATEGAWLPTGTEGTNPLTCDISGTPPGPIGSLIYRPLTGSVWALADNSDIATIATHMVVGSDATGYSIQAVGPVTIPGHGFTVGDQYYGDSLTLGGVTDVLPSAVGEVIRPAFNVIDGDKLELELVNEATQISSGGTLVSSNFFRGSRLSTQASVPANTPTIARPNFSLDDVGGNYNSTTGEYTVPTAGIYDVSGFVRFRANAFGFTTNAQASFFVNTQERIAGEDDENSSAFQRATVSGIVKVAAGDIITLRGEHGSAGNRDLVSCSMVIARVADI